MVISHSSHVGPLQDLAQKILYHYAAEDVPVSTTEDLLTGILSTQLALIDLLEEMLVHLEEGGSLSK